MKKLFMVLLVLLSACLVEFPREGSSSQGEIEDCTDPDQWDSCNSGGDTGTGGGGAGGSGNPAPLCNPVTYVECDRTQGLGADFLCASLCQSPSARCWPNDWPGCTGDQCAHYGICL